MNKKLTEKEIIEYIDKTISELVYEKTSIIKAYNYYHGKRDPEQFRHLEENYGIGTPTSVEFIPLVKKHIDVLIGEYLSLPLLPKISCKDKKTLSNIFRDKQLKINELVLNELKKVLNSKIYSAIKNEETPDKEVLDRIESLVESTDKNFISEYEIAGQNIIDHSVQSRNIDFIEKRKTLLIDLLVSGSLYFKTEPSPSNTNVNFKVLNPINTFIDKNSESPYHKNSSRAVIREFLTKQQILAKYGKYIKEEDLESLDFYDFADIGNNTSYVRATDSVNGAVTDGILGGFEISPYSLGTTIIRNFKTYPVYEVEWLHTVEEKDKFVTYRYEGVRINTDIYIKTGISENIIRTMDDPDNCTLSINGIFYLDRNGDPFSLILATANLQDKFDVLHFYRDNVIAESGSIGDWIDVAFIPKFLGEDLPKRIAKWKAYKKSGIALYDSSQEGNMMNTSFNGFDDAIKLDTIQAIDLAIQRIEETCSTITGIFREKLGGIEQRDAVTNVKVGITQSTFITKQYFQLMDLITREILLDILNICKIVYKNGITGVIVLGENLNKIFTALPKHFTLTDFDIHIPDSSEILKEQETIKSLTIELSKAGIADAEILIEVATSKSLTKMKDVVLGSIKKTKQDNNQLSQLSQQVDQLSTQLKNTETEAQKLLKQVQQLNQEKLQLEKDKLEFEKQIGWYKTRSDETFNIKKIELEKKRVDLEALQLIDDNENNNEIKNK